MKKFLEAARLKVWNEDAGQRRRLGEFHKITKFISGLFRKSFYVLRKIVTKPNLISRSEHVSGILLYL